MNKAVNVLHSEEEECYNSLASLVASKHKVFITQTKLLYEVTWRTVMHIAKKHVVSNINLCVTEEECYNSLASLVASKHKVFITQTKLLYEVTWRTVMHITKKHVISNINLCVTEEECYNSLASLVASKHKVFITQTKLLYEVTWRTVMHITKKHVISNINLCVTEEECYNSLASLVASKHKVFITQTKLLYEVTWRTVMHIAKKHVKNAAVHMQRHCPSTRTERIYMDWMWWILQGLPFNHLVRVMDCYLHEGIKVLYRVAMAIMQLFYKHSSPQNSDWMKEISDHGIDAALNKFCRQIPLGGCVR
ncbi:hypothetical protein J6590_038912 [Homalodisca vitripennis]|nr:hypothetical protein J6590_038912 [Homalodisca vitripennis]